MQTYQLSVPLSVRIEDIRAALSLIGEFKLIAKRPATTKPERTFQEPVIARKSDGSEREIDGIEVESKIKKMMSELRAQMNHDGRSNKDFAHWHHREPTVAEYVERFCSHHVKTEYQCGNTTFKA